MVRLYLMQHGEAMWEEHDPTRPLTEKRWADAPAREPGHRAVCVATTGALPGPDRSAILAMPSGGNPVMLLQPVY